MSLKDWKYYNHAVIPAVEPHEEPDLSCIKDKSIWNNFSESIKVSKYQAK